MTPASAHAPQRFSTDILARRDRLSGWREFLGRKLFRVDIEARCDTDDFEVDTVLRALPGLGFFSIMTSAAMHRRRPVDTDDLMIYVARSGTARYEACGRETVLAPGDAVLVGNGEPSLQETAADYRLSGVRIPRRVLHGIGPGLDDKVCRRIPAETPALRLLTLYADALRTDTGMVGHLPVVATHMRDLAALALGATGEAAEIATARSARAARLRAIKSDIEANLHEPRLSTATVAARHRLSERALQRLFEIEGSSCMGFILERRLARAHRMLTDPRFAGHHVKTIAFDAGFTYLSQFTSAFRSRFGVSASEVRAQALQAHDSDT